MSMQGIGDAGALTNPMQGGAPNHGLLKLINDRPSTAGRGRTYNKLGTDHLPTNAATNVHGPLNVLPRQGKRVLPMGVSNMDSVPGAKKKVISYSVSNNPYQMGKNRG